MINIDKRWEHRSLVSMDIEVISTPIKQLMYCMPSENRTPEEQELFEALEIVNKYINK